MSAVRPGGERPFELVGMFLVLREKRRVRSRKTRRSIPQETVEVTISRQEIPAEGASATMSRRTFAIESASMVISPQEIPSRSDRVAIFYQEIAPETVAGLSSRREITRERRSGRISCQEIGCRTGQLGQISRNWTRILGSSSQSVRRGRTASPLLGRSDLAHFVRPSL